MSDRILLCLAHMSGREMDFIKEAFADNWVVPLGPNVNGFEEDLEKFVNHREGPGIEPDCAEGHRCAPLDKKVVALSAGTAAVHLALIACGVGPGDEVLVQSFTFCASSHPVTYLGATPVFVDSEPETWNMDPDLLEQAIRDRIARTGRRPKAIIPVALYGMPYKIDRIMEIADRYGIPVIEDGAEGFGSCFRGQALGTFGRFGVLSFNGNKMITTSGGGALICPDDEAKRQIMWYATQARESYPYYQHEAIGYNYRMSNICAGIGRGQMTVLEEHIAHHRHVQALYEELLDGVEGIRMHTAPGPVTGSVGGAAGVTHAVESAVTDCQPNDNVEAMRMALDAAGIESRPLWKPMHRQPVYRHNPAYVNGVSEGLFKVGICLPAGPWVSDDNVRYIVDRIKEALIH